MEKNMIKVLVGDDTAEKGVRIASALREQGLYAYTRKACGSSIMKSIINDLPDVVIADLTLSDTDAVALMKEAEMRVTEMPAFIVTSDINNSFLERQVLQEGASYFLHNTGDVSDIAYIVKSVLNKRASVNCADIEILVTDVIRQLGIPAHIKGYQYLRTAILYTLECKGTIDCVTKQLYPAVADRYNTTGPRVERAIRHAIDTAWNRSQGRLVSTFFGYTSGLICERPTNSEFIAYVADKLRLQVKVNSAQYMTAV